MVQTFQDRFREDLCIRRIDVMILTSGLVPRVGDAKDPLAIMEAAEMIRVTNPFVIN